MKLQFATLASALAMSAGAAFAGPVSFDAQPLTTTGHHTVHYTFDVAAESLFSGAFTTLADSADNLSITSITLSRSGLSYVFDAADDAYKFLSISTDTSTTTVKGLTITHWTHAYELSPVTLSAGIWDVTVEIDQLNNKIKSSLSGNGLLNAVPEPQSLGLTLAALAALGLTARRRRA